jgi:TRAP-type mannitol/chloroaromatic compound transport system substrate-binding protein
LRFNVRSGNFPSLACFYYPGFWEGGPAIRLFINPQKWNELPKSYRAANQAAAGCMNLDTQATYDAKNPAGLRNLICNGGQRCPFSQDIMEAAYKAANEISAKNPDFKKLYGNCKAFRNEEYLWFQVAEYTYDTFMILARARG